MREKETFWYPCPDCGEKMLKVRRDTVLISFPAYCKHCKDTKIITEIEPLSLIHDESRVSGSFFISRNGSRIAESGGKDKS